VQSLINQSYPPKEIVIVDRNPSPANLTFNSVFAHLFSQMDATSITWSVMFGDIIVNEVCHFEYILEIKDRYIFESDYLKNLVDVMEPEYVLTQGKIRFYNINNNSPIEKEVNEKIIYNKSTAEISRTEKLRDQDNWVYREIFDLNLYRVERSEIENKNLIDIGANKGFFSILANELGISSIIAIEANSETFKMLEQNIKEIPNTKCILGAVLNHDFNAPTININSDFTPTDGKCYVTTDDSQSQLDIYSLKDLVSMIDNTNDCILKIDCEGSEYPILYGADQDTLNRFSYLYIEIHEGDRNPITYNKKLENIQSLLNYLEYMGFKVLTDIQMGEFPGVHVYKLFNDRSKKSMKANIL
jgi:FkbM family methyltransferase